VIFFFTFRNFLWGCGSALFAN